MVPERRERQIVLFTVASVFGGALLLWRPLGIINAAALEAIAVGLAFVWLTTLVRTVATGVCHSDLHFWEGVYDLGGGKQLKLTDRGMTLPLTMGHETVGEVAAAGPDARDVKVGDRRLVYPWIGCGECKVCRRGDEQLCLKPRFLGVFRPGGYSDFLLVPHARYLVDFGDLPPEQAAPFACSGVTASISLRYFSR